MMYGGYSRMELREIDKKPVDGWTAVHLGIGVGAGLVGFPMLLTLAVALFWEAAENWKRPDTNVLGFTPETNVNALIDIVAALGGWGIGAAIAAGRS